ncbi:MAG: hypothetical protein R2939_18610 [Kofleriaceae bacterium]
MSPLLVAPGGHCRWPWRRGRRQLVRRGAARQDLARRSMTEDRDAGRRRVRSARTGSAKVADGGTGEPGGCGSTASGSRSAGRGGHGSGRPPAPRSPGLRGICYKERATRVIQPMLGGNVAVGEAGTVDRHHLWSNLVTSASAATGADGTAFTERRTRSAPATPASAVAGGSAARRTLDRARPRSVFAWP